MSAITDMQHDLIDYDMFYASITKHNAGVSNENIQDNKVPNPHGLAHNLHVDLCSSCRGNPVETWGNAMNKDDWFDLFVMAVLIANCAFWGLEFGFRILPNLLGLR